MTLLIQEEVIEEDIVYSRFISVANVYYMDACVDVLNLPSISENIVNVRVLFTFLNLICSVAPPLPKSVPCTPNKSSKHSARRNNFNIWWSTQSFRIFKISKKKK